MIFDFMKCKRCGQDSDFYENGLCSESCAYLGLPYCENCGLYCDIDYKDDKCQHCDAPLEQSQVIKK